MTFFFIALLQAARCSGYRAWLPTIVPGFNTHWGCDCVEWKNSEYKEKGKKHTRSSLFFTSKPLHYIQHGWGSDASLRDSNNMPVAFSLTQATYRYALVRLTA